MPSRRTVSANALPRQTNKELDIYAAEFAKLVDRHSPSRGDTPSEWLRQLPDEAFHYYKEGISTFGSRAESPIERRGRLYIIHTALLFMWMSWGKTTARKRFQSEADEGTRRAASLITLERYRRAGVLAHYSVDDWFSQRVGEWGVTIISGAVNLEEVKDESLSKAVREQTTVSCPVRSFSLLRTTGAIPSRHSLTFNQADA